MTQNIETEFKTILSKKEYHNLLTALGLNTRTPIHQTNLYFDTPQKTLEQHLWGLRLRMTETYAHLTLKTPLVAHRMLETTDRLTQDQGHHILNTHNFHHITATQITTQLKKLDVTLEDLILIGSFKTSRYETKWQDTVIALDHCHFATFEDYELEMETTGIQEGMQKFEKFLKSYRIDYRLSQQKIVRMKRQTALYPNL